MKKPLILIVEDDVWLGEHYSRVLAKAYRIKTVTNAIEAIDLIDDLKPDAIILDILLTGSTAFALLHELQSYSDTGVIPVIICTNLATGLSLDDLKPYGVAKIIDKAHMIPEDLPAALRGVL